MFKRYNITNKQKQLVSRRELLNFHVCYRYHKEMLTESRDKLGIVVLNHGLIKLSK
jgi:hypothetical protein